jgi:predicted ribosome quality control (RQC) complex YloA/Tae2 family protein
MYKNYYLFESQINFLNKKVGSSRVLNCFTHRKDELVLHLQNDETCFLRLGIQIQTPYLIIDPVQNIKTPKINLFKNLRDDKIINFTIVPFDKHIKINFEKFTLHGIFYGRNQNIYLTSNDGVTLESFKIDKKTSDSTIKTAKSEILAFTELSTFKRTDIIEPVSLFIQQRLGGFNKILAIEICFRSDIKPDTALSTINIQKWDRLIENIEEINDELKDGDVYLYEHPQKPIFLSLVRLHHLTSDYETETYKELNQAWKQFIYRYRQKYTTDHLLIQSRKKIRNRINYLEKTLKKITNFRQLKEKKVISELKGHLLLTHLTKIERGIDQVKLKNIYSATEEHISIKLDPKISIQENAGKYFEKYKNIDGMKENLKLKKDTYTQELNFWKKTYTDAEKIGSLKKAEKLEQLLEDKHLLQKEGINKKKIRLDRSSFNRLLIDQKWEILIGKNAHNNDLLTFKFSNKHDIWLHAQGVAGSHVVIHLADKNHKPPLKVIEQAASVAAYFSAAKNSSTVPVNYTEVRYVRKPRKAQPGTVLMFQAKTIFVEPKKVL